MIYKDWLREWLRLYVKPSVKERTYDKYVIKITAPSHFYCNGADILFFIFYFPLAP